jgi:asparagine synthase (glutamine-hydrolysing)
MFYTPFCYVQFFQRNAISLPPDYTSLGLKGFFLGRSYSEALLGNIHPYDVEYKNFEASKITQFVSHLDSNPTSFLHDFVGDFSFVYHMQNQTILAARDHNGVFPLFYYHDSNVLIISNDQRLMLEIPSIDLTPDPQWMGEFVQGSHELTDATYYKNIKQVPPAHILLFQDNQLTIERYWELDLSKPMPHKPEKEYIQEFNALLIQAVETRIPDGVQVGSEVSGGIDCTSVAAIAKRYLDQQQRPLFTYGHSAFDTVHFSSEREAIDAFLLHLKPTKNTFIPQKLVGMRSIASHAFRLRNGIAHCHYALFSRDVYAAAQADNVSIVFSGLGGDHGVSYRGSSLVLNELARKGSYKRLFQALKVIHGKTIQLLVVFVVLIIRNTLFKNAKEKPSQNEKMQQSKARTIVELQKEFPALANFSTKSPEEISRNMSPQASIKERVSKNELSFRCASTTIAASHFGVLYRYPLLDIRLLQYFVSLPSHMYFNKGINRYIFRQTIQQYVPSIAFQPKPPANMYGWILEAYKHDFENQLAYDDVPEDDEIRLYQAFWKHRDEQCYAGNGYFKDMQKLVGNKISEQKL